MKKYLISTLLVGAMVLSFARLNFAEDAGVPADSGGVQALDNAMVSGPVYVYNEFAASETNTYTVKLKGATYLTVSGGDCCDVGDTYTITAMRKKPSPKQTKTGTFGSSIASTCEPPTSGYNGDVTLNDPKKVVVKVKPKNFVTVWAHGSYLKFDSDGKMAIKTKGTYCGVCCVQESGLIK